MDESGFWEQLRSSMRGYWEAQRIESSTGEGIPDVFYTIPGQHGWIELKNLQAMPKRPTTPVKIRHFEALQKHWLAKHGKLGGNCWLLVKAAKEWFLFGYWQVYEVEEWTADEWREKAVLYMSMKFDSRLFFLSINRLGRVPSKH